MTVDKDLTPDDIKRLQEKVKHQQINKRRKNNVPVNSNAMQDMEEEMRKKPKNANKAAHEEFNFD